MCDDGEERDRFATTHQLLTPAHRDAVDATTEEPR
jgi:hypothetical protein